jgi:hypothetical protein
MFRFEPAIEPGVSALPVGWPAICNVSNVAQKDKPLEERFFMRTFLALSAVVSAMVSYFPTDFLPRNYRWPGH